MRELQAIEINQVNGGVVGIFISVWAGMKDKNYSPSVPASILLDTAIYTLVRATTPGTGGFAVLEIPSLLVLSVILDSVGYKIGQYFS